MIKKYRKKPVVIEAVQFTGSRESYREVMEFISGQPISDAAADGPFLNPWLKTLEGEMTVSVGDFVIRGVAGECYSCRPHIFMATYEPEDVDDVGTVDL